MSDMKPGEVRVWINKKDLEGLTETEIFYRYAEFMRGLMLGHNKDFVSKEIRVLTEISEPTECFVPTVSNLEKSLACCQ